MSQRRDDQGRPCAGFRQAWRLSRRQLLAAGSLGVLGLDLPRLWSLRAQAAESPLLPQPRAKACIFLFMWGGPSQLDTFDPKPDAPAEVRGEFQPISTSVPGVQICEHFRQLAPLVDRLAIVRSLTHTDPAHLSSGHATLTGNWARIRNSDAEPPSPRDNPHIGSVMARLRPSAGTLPPFVTLPWKAYHPAAPGGQAPGQSAGLLGEAYDPFLVTGDPNQAAWQVSELSLLDGLSVERLHHRQDLLQQIDEQARLVENSDQVGGVGALQSKAFGLLAADEARRAFDLTREPEAVRDRYGRNLHGQCVLLARRLVEHGVPLVSVNWHNDGQNFWDTHGNNFNRLKHDLIPPADQALAALLTDLEERGLLDETLVAWVGEFGRRPQITRGNAGRDHWPFCYSGLLAGGGIRGGAVYGESDKQAARPARNPVTPLDYAATMYQALGIDPHGVYFDPTDRPVRISQGQPIAELFG
ncbi:MAG: DUF1501 domain-containing protein [Pirellulales bacterium]|nr:DUF1501 domain-containing protein [Pirellulales bacterium]